MRFLLCAFFISILSYLNGQDSLEADLPSTSNDQDLSKQEHFQEGDGDTQLRADLQALKEKVQATSAQTEAQRQTLQCLVQCIQELEQQLNYAESYINGMYAKVAQNEQLSSSVQELQNSMTYIIECNLDQIRMGLDQLRSQQECALNYVAGDINALSCQINALWNAILPPPPLYRFNSTRCSCDLELLVWSIQETQLDFVIAGGAPTQGIFFVNGAIGVQEFAHFGWRPGFRLALDYTTCHDQWDLLGQYTFFYCQGNDSVSISPPSTLNATFHQVVGPEQLLGEAKSGIAFHYNILDLLLAKNFRLSPAIHSRIQVGGTGAWIYQDWKIDYFPVAGATTEEVKLDWKFQGPGLKVGGWLDWHVSNCWSLLTEANWGALLGWYSNRLKITNFTSDVVVDIPINVKNQQWRFAQTFQVRLGPCWTMNWRRCKAAIYTLFEMNTWLGLQEVDRSFLGDAPTEGRDSRHVEGFLGLYGLTIGANFAF